MDESDRNEFLKPLIPELIGTSTTQKDGQTRGLLAADWLIRDMVPAWLSLVPSLQKHSEVLAACKPIQSCVEIIAVTEALRVARLDSAAARDAAGAAAWAAAGAAAGVAAWAAAGAAAVDAARAAAGAAAGVAARNAAVDAAWAAAVDAAWAAAVDAARAAAVNAAWAAAGAAAGVAARNAAVDAAWAAVNPTKRRLQESAANLVRRMCAVGK
jgi:hypothetical protein